MDYRILGPLEVRDDGRPVELRRQKPKALLAFLLLHTGRPVSTGLLVDALWGERPPATAAAALRNYVSQLRGVLGADAIRSRPGGYLLDVAPEEVDLLRFEALTAEGRRTTGPERVEKLREALALWRGPPLADLSEEFAVGEARRLEELRAAALEDLVDAELAEGSRADLVAELEPLIAENPFRERLRGQLMLALYRRGRQAEALEAYQQTRRTLLSELGIEPGEALRALEQAILRQDPTLTAPALPVENAPIVPQEERRKTVTVLFVDLVVSEDLDPEVLRSATLRALGAVRGALEVHGATIEQRSGDEVMAVFGVPRSHEDDALRAARAALDVLGAVREQAETVVPAIQVRVGIDTAEVLAGADAAGHGFIAGPAILLARRRLQEAEPGEIRAGRGTLALLGGAVISEPVAGDAETGVRVLRLVEGVAALHRHLEAPLIGRKSELGRLAAAFQRVADERRCGLFLLLGEPGIGKTRLTAELTARLADEAKVLTGRCVSYGRGATFLPLVELVRIASTETDLRELLAADEHAELITASLSELIGEGAPVSRSDTFWAVRRLFETIAEERPLVLVLEDLHWAEPTLLDLLDYLSAQARTAPIFVLGIARPELLERRPEWLAADAITLGPLTATEGESLIEQLADVPPRLRTTILSTAGGNPLFLEQLLAHATEGGDPETAPPSLAALLASRLDRLEADELSLLQRAAIVGREFDRRAVAHLRPEGLERGDEVLPSLVRKGFLVELESDLVGFRHVLIRDAAYSTLPKGQRAELHERFARWLAGEQPVADEVVGFHLEQAYRYLVEIGPASGRAAELAGEAGERLGAAGLRAWRRADTTGAIDLLGRAAELLPRSAVTRLELLCELGLALRTAGEIERADAVLGEAAELAAAAGDERVGLRARIELANARLSREPEGGAGALLQLLDEAIPIFEGFGDDRSLGRAWLLSGYVHGGLHCRNDDWLHASQRALVHYRRSRWPAASCAGEMATALYYGPMPAREAIARCKSLLADLTERTAEAHVLVWLAGLEAFDGRLEPARRMAEQAHAVYEEFGYRMALACGCCAVIAEIESLAGRLDKAEAALRSSCDRLQAMQERACLASRAAELADVVYQRGSYEEAERWHSVARRHAASDDVGAQFLIGAIGAKILARQGSFGEAERVARAAVRLAEQTDALNNRGKVQLDLAEVLRLSGRADEAAAPAALALQQFERKGNRVAAERARALLEQGRR